jgi:copper(I)-binding protein
MTTLRRLAAALAFLAAPSALAQPVIEGGPVPLDAIVEFSIRIDAGCGGAATDTVIVGLPPAGLSSVQPMAKPGWTIEIVGDGEQPTGIAWTGGPLLDGQYDRFTFRAAIGGLAEGTELAFPVVQRCGAAEVVWDGAAAPTVQVQPAEAAVPTSFETGAITAIEPWARATPPGAAVGGVYLSVANAADGELLLTGGSTPVADLVEIHSMRVENNVMRMSEVEGGLPLPPGGIVALEPGGFHLMLQGLLTPLVEGTTFPLTLTFGDGATLDITVQVRSLTGEVVEPEHQH